MHMLAIKSKPIFDRLAEQCEQILLEWEQIKKESTS